MSHRRTKKQRTAGLPSFGAPSDSDVPFVSPDQDPSSSASSTRIVGISAPSALTTICARVFVTNFLKLRKDTNTWSRTSHFLRALPDVLIPKIFAMLCNSYPTYLNHEVIVTYFLRGPSVTLRKDLPGVQKRTILDIPRFNHNLRELELTGFNDIVDESFAHLLRKLSHLQSINLRGCTKVGAETMRAIAQTSPDLRILNLNYTSVTPSSLAPVVKTDATLLSKFFAELPHGFQLPNLHNLKLRQTSIGDASLHSILNLCPALQRLDISFTTVHHPPHTLADSPIPALEKLSLTSTAVSLSDLVEVLGFLPKLRTLNIGAIGAAYQLSRASLGNTTALTMTDDMLLSLVAVLEQMSFLENVSLVGNAKLGLNAKYPSAMSTFITRVGRKCKKLNLARIHGVNSCDLAGLVAGDGEGHSLLEDLILNNTAIDDEAGHYIATCLSLRTLAVAGTKMTETGMFEIIDSCEKLETLDLTSCRSIKVVDRRRFFEVWKQARS